MALPASCYRYEIGRLRRNLGNLRFVAKVGLARPDTGCSAADLVLSISSLINFTISLNSIKLKQMRKLTLFLIFLLIFFNDFSSALVSGNLVGIG